MGKRRIIDRLPHEVIDFLVRGIAATGVRNQGFADREALLTDLAVHPHFAVLQPPLNGCSWASDPSRRVYRRPSAIEGRLAFLAARINNSSPRA